MNATNYKAISLEPYLCKEGDVVSAEVWNSVLGLFVNRLNSVSDYFKQYDSAFSTISNTLTEYSAALIDVNASLAQTKQTWDDWVNKYQTKLDNLDSMCNTYLNITQVQEALEDGLVHYGETAPTNEHVRIWVAPMNDIASYRLLTNADIDISFNSESEKAQSGVAVAEAIEGTVGNINAVLSSVVEGVVTDEN